MGRETRPHPHHPASEPRSASPERHHPAPIASAHKPNKTHKTNKTHNSNKMHKSNNMHKSNGWAAASVLSSLALDRELEMDVEASDTTLRRHEEAALRVSEHAKPFSSSRLQPFHLLSEQSVARAVARFQSRTSPQLDPSGPWKLVKEQADVRVFRSAARRGKTTAMLAHGLVRGSLAEVLDGLYAETTKEARVLYALLSPAFVDVAVLHVDSYRTAQHPFQFAGVAWMALETPRGGCGVCKDRDFVCFKRMGTIKDPDGGDQELGFLTLHSVDQPPSDPTAAAAFAAASSSSAASVPFSYMGSSSSEFVRGAVSLTAFFKQLPNGLVAMSVQGDFNARGRLAARLADQMFAELVFALGRAAKCGQAKSLAMLLQSISAGQLPPGGIAASASGSHVAHLLPLLSEKNRDRCGVCSKTLWRVLLESPEFCRSCWTRTCRNCHVTMPIYCADFHRAHDDEGSGAKKKTRRLPKPCKETFCLKCVCSVLPNGIKMNAKLLKQTAKKRKHAKKHGGGASIVTDPSLMRRGIGRTAASARHVPSSAMSNGSKSGHRNTNHHSGGSSRNGREPGKLYVQIPRPHQHHHLRSRGTASSSDAKQSAAAGGPGVSAQARHFDDHSSISMLSSVESEKLQRQRLSLNKPSASKLLAASGASEQPSNPSKSGKSQPSSMLEVLENYQLSQLTTTMSADYSEPLNDDDVLDRAPSELALSYNSYSTDSITDGAIHPADRAPPSLSSTGRKLQVRVRLTPRKRARRSSTASSLGGGSMGGSQSSSKRTNYATSVRQSPHLSGQPSVFDDAYYNHALQRYLTKRRTSLGLSTSTSMSTDQFESLDKASAEATARAAALAGLHATSNATVASTSSGSNAGGGGNGAGRDAHKLRILRDLEPFPRTPSFLDRPLTPSRISISSLSSGGSPRSSRASSTAEATGSHASLFDSPQSAKRPTKGEWAPPAY